MELILRFFLGGAIVAAFAVLAEMWKPATFAGMFGAAPSVAIASLALIWTRGGDHVAEQARSMVLGSVAMLLYAIACTIAARRRRVPIWLGAAAAWLVWFAAAFALYGLARAVAA